VAGCAGSRESMRCRTAASFDGIRAARRTIHAASGSLGVPWLGSTDHRLASWLTSFATVNRAGRDGLPATVFDDGRHVIEVRAACGRRSSAGHATAVLEGQGRESFSSGLAEYVWVASSQTAGEDSRPFLDVLVRLHRR